MIEDDGQNHHLVCFSLREHFKWLTIIKMLQYNVYYHVMTANLIFVLKCSFVHCYKARAKAIMFAYRFFSQAFKKNVVVNNKSALSSLSYHPLQKKHFISYQSFPFCSGSKSEWNWSHVWFSLQRAVAEPSNKKILLDKEKILKRTKNLFKLKINPFIAEICWYFLYTMLL